MNLWFNQLKSLYTNWHCGKNRYVKANISWVKKLVIPIVFTFIGLCLYYIILNLVVYKTLLNPYFHESLIASSEIYSYVNLISDEITSNTNVSIPLSTIKLNLPLVTKGLIDYIKGSNNLLPDIYLKDASFSFAPFNDSVNHISKVNLSTILLFLKSSNISDKLEIIRTFYKLLRNFFNIIGLFLLFLILILFILNYKNKHIIKCWRHFIYFSGSLFLLVPLTSYLYLRWKLSWFLPSLFTNLNTSWDTKDELIYLAVSYTKKCIGYITFYTFLFGILLTFIFLAFLVFKRLSYYIKYLNNFLSKNRVLILFVIVLIIILLIQNLFDLRDSLMINNIFSYPKI